MEHYLSIEVTVHCPFFNFETFPFDHQICHLFLRSSTSDTFEIIGNVEFRENILNAQHPTIPFVISNHTIDKKSNALNWVRENNLSYIGTELGFKRWLWPYAR